MRKIMYLLVILSTCSVLNSARTFALGDHYTVEQVIDLYSKDKNIVLAFFNGVGTAINWANSALEAQGRTRLYCPPEGQVHTAPDYFRIYMDKYSRHKERWDEFPLQPPAFIYLKGIQVEYPCNQVLD